MALSTAAQRHQPQPSHSACSRVAHIGEPVECVTVDPVLHEPQQKSTPLCITELLCSLLLWVNSGMQGVRLLGSPALLLLLVDHHRAETAVLV